VIIAGYPKYLYIKSGSSPSWLPVTDSCKNFSATLFIKIKQRFGEDSANMEGRETAGLESSASLGAQ
jgi:hypothetical protein